MEEVFQFTGVFRLALRLLNLLFSG